jgi:hypothetical protein
MILAYHCSTGLGLDDSQGPRQERGRAMRVTAIRQDGPPRAAARARAPRAANAPAGPVVAPDPGARRDEARAEWNAEQAERPSISTRSMGAARTCRRGDLMPTRSPTAPSSAGLRVSAAMTAAMLAHRRDAPADPDSARTREVVAVVAGQLHDDCPAWTWSSHSATYHEGAARRILRALSRTGIAASSS